jgi:hypothetical protein
MIAINLVTPKAAAKQELFKQIGLLCQFAELISKTSGAHQSVTKFIEMTRCLEMQ